MAKIKIGITKEFSLEVAPVMMEQLDQIFKKGVYADFTDAGVYFSINPKPFLSRLLKEPYWETPESLKFYKWVLVVGQHQTVSREFSLNQFFSMMPSGKLIVFPYILSNRLAPIDHVPHAIFNLLDSLESIEPGKNSTPERVLERLQQMDLLDPGFTWKPQDGTTLAIK